MNKDYDNLAVQYGSVKAMTEELSDQELLECYEQLSKSPEVLIELERRGLPTPLDFE